MELGPEGWSGGREHSQKRIARDKLEPIIRTSAGQVSGSVCGPFPKNVIANADRSPMRWLLRSKIHKATVTGADVNYEGSITIDEELIDAVGLSSGEKVLVVSNSSGARLETYVIAGPRGSRTICMNGAAAHLIKKGEEVIIMGFELGEPTVDVRSILLGPENEPIRYLSGGGTN